MSDTETGLRAEQLAQQFHEAYERLAPQFSYETRKASAKPWAEVPENNRKLMIAVCGEILSDQPAMVKRATGRTIPDMTKLVEIKRTYKAKSFDVAWETKTLTIAGTLDGFIDLATPNGTYPLSIAEASSLATALRDSVSDVETNCLHDRDALLESPEPEESSQ